MTSYLRMSDRGRETSATLALRAAVEVRPRPIVDSTDGFGHVIPGRPTFEVVGECGHVMEVVGNAEAHYWRIRIAGKRRHRKRCPGCPRKSE